MPDFTAENNKALRDLLRIAVKPSPLEEMLGNCLDIILDVSWLSLLPKAGIFLTGSQDREPNVLYLVAERNMGDVIKELCSEVEFGHCLCGCAAQSRKSVHTSRIDQRHKTYSEKVEQHGHYNIPILSDDRVLGVIVLYLPPDTERNDDGIGFLELVADTLSLVISLNQQSNELKASIKKLDFQKTALDEHAIVSIADVKGNITYANNKFCEISGYSREELLGQNHRILKSDEHPTELFEKLWKTIAGGKPWHGEIKNTKKDGGFYWVNASIVPFLDDREKPYMYVGIRTDITESKRVEEALHKTKDELEVNLMELDASGSAMERQAAEMVEIAEDVTVLNDKLKYESDVKNRFFSIISHDLKSPFTTLLGMTQIMSQMGDGFSKEKLIEYAASVNESGNRVYELLQNLLDWSRLQMEGAKFEPQTIPLQELTQESIDILIAIAQEKNITLTNGVTVSSAYADRNMVTTVIRNLIANAVKFTPAGGKIQVTSSTKEFALKNSRSIDK